MVDPERHGYYIVVAMSFGVNQAQACWADGTWSRKRWDGSNDRSDSPLPT